MFQQSTTAIILALLLLLVAPGLSSDESSHLQRRSLGFASSFSFTNLMYKLHICNHPGPLCGPPKCGPGPHPPRLCDYYQCSSDDCSFDASIDACGDDTSCLASYYYYQDQGGDSSSSSSSSSIASSNSEGNDDYYDYDSSNDDDGSFGRTGVSEGGSTYEIQNAVASFSPMPYVIGGFLLVGVLAFIVMGKRNIGNKELTEALGPHDEKLDDGIVARRLQHVESGVVQPGSLTAERNSTTFIEMVDSQPTMITTIPDATEVAIV